MKFSEIQKKEVIDVKKGTFLGFIQDASIDIENGKIESFHIGGDRSFFFDSKEKGIKKVAIEDVLTIGKDIILIGKNEQTTN